MDIFKSLGITDSDGNPISENNVNPLMGYQIVHKVTGRMLPQTQSYEIMGADYAQTKYAQVWLFYLDTEYHEEIANEYEFEPVYLQELDESLTGFLLLYSEKDEKHFSLFN